MHSILPPSGAEKWACCPASLVDELLFPDISGPEAEEGERNHAEAAECLSATAPIPPDAPWREYAEYVRGVLGSPFTSDVYGIEQRVNMPSIHNECFGTPDFFLLSIARNLLCVADYKHGRVPVDVVRCLQLLCYAIGVLDTYAPDGITDQAMVVRLTIAQPNARHRDGKLRHWEFPAHHLRNYANRLHAAAHEALGPNPRRVTGAHCVYCRARHACPALDDLTSRIGALTMMGLLEPLEGAPLGRELLILQDMQKLLQARISGIEGQIDGLIAGGGAVPGWARQAAYGRQAWTESPSKMIAIAQEEGVDIGKLALLTPKQAIKAGLSAEIVKQYSEAPFRGHKLVPEKQTAAHAAFGKD